MSKIINSKMSRAAQIGAVLFCSTIWMEVANADEKFKVDILSDGPIVFTFPDTPAVDTIPGLKGGTKFIVTGTLYKGGALAQCQENLPCVPSSPPIGKWYCYSTFLVDSWVPGQPLVVGDMLFDFSSSPSKDFRLMTRSGTFGGNTIMALGFEANAFQDRTTFYRAVVGGTGVFKGANGELKLNAGPLYGGKVSLLVNFDVELD